MWAPEIAAQLRRRGPDVVAVAERSERRGQPDPVVFATAQVEGRAVVTENVIDFRPLAALELQQGHTYFGLILTSNRRWPRHDPRTVGRLISALNELLSGNWDATSAKHWLS